MQVETLSQAYRAGWRVHVRCAQGKHFGLKSIPECLWSRELDMETLVATRGRDFPLARLAMRLRCPACGSPSVSVAFIPPSGVARLGAAG